MKRMIALMVALTVLVASLAAIPFGGLAEASTVTITDMAGRTVEIPSQIERVACHSSTCEAVLISLGRADLLVGTTDYVNEDSYAYKLFPELSGVAKLEDDMSVEEMLQNQVQLVFVKDENKIERYEEAGLPVIYLELDTIAGTKEGIKLVGDIIGVPERADWCVNYIDQCQSLIEQRLADAQPQPITTYYARAKYKESNLLTTYAASHIYGQWISLCGGEVITRDMELKETKGGVLLNAEELIAADPDVIFVGGYFRNSVYQEALNGEYKDVLSAVANGAVYIVPTSVSDWSVGGCELGLAMLWCATSLYPDLFADIDMPQEVVDFYANASGVQVSGELAESILNSELSE